MTKIGPDTVIRHQPRVPPVTPVQVAQGPAGPPGGSDAAQAGWINDSASATRAALSATYATPFKTLRVAAADTPMAALRAEYVCDGIDDLATIQQALDALPDSATVSGEVQLLSGTYNDASGGTVAIGSPSSATLNNRKTLRFQRGARINVSNRTGRIAVVKVEGNNCQVINPEIAGDTARGNGTGIAFGGDVATFGGRWDKVIGLSHVEDPIIRNLATGVEFTSIDAVGSTGDCFGIGGQLEQCKTGVRAAGYINRWYALGVFFCDVNVWVESRRAEAQLDVYGSTLNNWYQQAVKADGGAGSTFHDTWMEHTVVTGAPTEAVLIGLSNATRASNIRFTGKTLAWLSGESYAFRLVGSHGLEVDELQLSTSGQAPVTSIIRNDTSTSSKNNRFKRILFGPNPTPAHALISGTGAGEVFVDRKPGAVASNEYTTVPNLTGAAAETQVVVKAADESLASSTTLHDDAELKIPLISGATYLLDGVILFDADQGGDLAASFAVPAGCDIKWVGPGADTASVSATGTAAVITRRGAPGSVLNWGGAGQGIPLGVAVKGLVVVGAASTGNLVFQWAQATSLAGPTKVLLRSWLRLQRIA